jgi:hypothetical protein
MRMLRRLMLATLSFVAIAAAAQNPAAQHDVNEARAMSSYSKGGEL